MGCCDVEGEVGEGGGCEDVDEGEGGGESSQEGIMPLSAATCSGECGGMPRTRQANSSEARRMRSCSAAA